MQPQASPIVKDEYNDNPIDRLFIWIFAQKMSQALGASTEIGGYGGFVDLSKQIMQGRNPQQQQIVVAKVLQSLVPAPVLWAIRTFFAPTQLVCVLNAWFAAQMFEWLVGSCEVAVADITLADGTLRSQPSGVHIKKCRYLAESGCVGMCVNMCKVPTQEFFTKKFGIPLTMTPNFENLSCEMIFGQMPFTPDIDPDYTQPCLQLQCPTATKTTAPCPQLARSSQPTAHTDKPS
jgi:Beta-carotene isomerase D27-like, C-terminal